jgi:hypothetical protein
LPDKAIRSALVIIPSVISGAAADAASAAVV